MEKGEAIYKEVCFACHGDDGRGTSLAGGPAGTTMAPSLASSTRVQAHRDYVTKTLLHGMDGPIEGKTYAGGVMAPMGTNRDEWIAAIASYVRNSFGNVGSFVSTADVSRVRADTASRKTFWKVDELMASLPTPLDVLPTWKASASHNPGSALGALNFASWTTGAPQQPGMWFQVELPEPAVITEIQFNAAGSGFPGGGGRGRGAAGAPRGRSGSSSADDATATGRSLPACIQSGNVDQRHVLENCCGGSGHARRHDNRVCADRGQIRSNNADGDG